MNVIVTNMIKNQKFLTSGFFVESYLIISNGDKHIRTVNADNILLLQSVVLTKQSLNFLYPLSQLKPW